MWLKIVTAFRSLKTILTVFGVIKDVAIAIAEYLRLKEQKKESESMKEAEEKIEEANKIQDPAERLKKKAEAACELEKTLNPNSDC